VPHPHHSPFVRPLFPYTMQYDYLLDSSPSNKSTRARASAAATVDSCDAAATWHCNVQEKRLRRKRVSKFNPILAGNCPSPWRLPTRPRYDSVRSPNRKIQRRRLGVTRPNGGLAVGRPAHGPPTLLAPRVRALSVPEKYADERFCGFLYFESDLPTSLGLMRWQIESSVVSRT